MSPTDPNVQVLIELVSGVHARLDRQDVELAEIKSQVKETNGRVGTIERWRIKRDAINEERERRGEKSASSRVTWLGLLIGGPCTAVLTVALTHLLS